MELIKPKELTVTDGEGKTRIYTLSKFPAIIGREIVTKYPTSALPKLGDYAVSEETMLKLMNFVAVDNSTGTPLRLSTRALVDNHVPDWETLAKIELAMMEYNCSFFAKGTLFDSLQDVVLKVLARISEISTPLSAPSSPTEKPASTN